MGMFQKDPGQGTFTNCIRAIDLLYRNFYVNDNENDTAFWESQQAIQPQPLQPKTG